MKTELGFLICKMNMTFPCLVNLLAGNVRAEKTGTKETIKRVVLYSEKSLESIFCPKNREWQAQFPVGILENE